MVKFDLESIKVCIIILIMLQAFAVCISCITGAAFGANIIKAETTTQIVAKLYQAHSENTQVMYHMSIRMS